MIVVLKINEFSIVSGGKNLMQHLCSTTKEVSKTSGLAFCLTLGQNDVDGLFGRIGHWGDVKKRTVCTALIVGSTEIMYHVAEYVFGFDKQDSTRSEAPK